MEEIVYMQKDVFFRVNVEEEVGSRIQYMYMTIAVEPE